MLKGVASIQFLCAHILNAALALAILVLGAHRALVNRKALRNTEAACRANRPVPHRLVGEVVDEGEDEAVDNRLRQQAALRREGEDNARDEENEEERSEESHDDVHVRILIRTQKVYLHLRVARSGSAATQNLVPLSFAQQTLPPSQSALDSQSPLEALNPSAENNALCAK